MDFEFSSSWVLVSAIKCLAHSYIAFNTISNYRMSEISGGGIRGHCVKIYIWLNILV